MCPRRVAVDDLTALCDFIAGSSLKQIARRYRWTMRTTEAHIRHAFIAYGFGPGMTARRPPRRQFVRVVSRTRREGFASTGPAVTTPRYYTVEPAMRVIIAALLEIA